MKFCAMTAALVALTVASSAKAAVVAQSIPDLTAAPTTFDYAGGGAGTIYGKFVVTDAPFNIQSVQVVIQSDFGPSAGPNPFQQFGYSLTHDVGGLPNNITGGIVGGGTGAGQPGFSWINTGNGTTIVTFGIPGFGPGGGSNAVLQPGTYWLGIGGIQSTGIAIYGSDPGNTVAVASSVNGAGATPLSGTMGFAISGAINPIPEPATWVMLISGFGLVGFALRRRASLAVA